MATTTRAQDRATAKAEYDAFLVVCSSRQLLERISDQWVVLVLCALGGDGSHHGDEAYAGAPGAMRSALARSLAGVSQKMLTQTLRSLERDGLLTRTVTPTVAVTVAYELTDLGRSLQDLTRVLRGWAGSRMSEVIEHRGAHVDPAG